MPRVEEADTSAHHQHKSFVTFHFPVVICPEGLAKSPNDVVVVGLSPVLIHNAYSGSIRDRIPPLGL